MKQLTLILGLLFFLPCLFALSISPASISINSYGGQCDQVPLTITNSHETDLVAYLYYATDLNDTTGLSLIAENPFVALKGNTQIPLQICTVSNFAPSTFTIELYADANIEERIDVINYRDTSGSSTRIIYQDKNITKYVDRNVVIQVPKEIIKEIQITKEVPVEKIVYVDKNIPTTVFGTPDATGQLIVGIIVLAIAGAIIYFIFIKKQEVNKDGS